MTVLAVVLAAVAAAIVVGPRSAVARLREAKPDRAVGKFGAATRAWVAALVITCGAMLGLADGLRLALGLIVVGAVCGAAVLVARGRRRKAADERQAKVVEVCEALVGELRSGQPLVTCLEHCVDVWSQFEPVAAAGRLGADVPGAMRRVAGLPGAKGVREVASAWQVSEGSGAGLSSALSQVAASARNAQATRELVRSELASAQATARLVAALPVVALAMSAGMGGDPWGFLLDTPAGLVCLGVGVALSYAGLLWIDHIASVVLHR